MRLHLACILLLWLCEATYTHFHCYNKKRDCCRGLVLIWIALVIEGTLGPLPIFMTSLLHGCAGLFLKNLILALSLQHI